MLRPRIGITCDLGARNFPEAPRERPRHLLMDAYVEAVLKAGGAPLLLPAVEDERAGAAALEGVDGLIISGNACDIDPALYGEERLPACNPPNPRREAAEMASCRAAMARDMPVLGICGGMQVLNVAAGGALWQDIPSQIEGALPHAPKNPDKNTYVFHEVEVEDSILREILGSASEVNSHHHQSAREAGPGVRVSARTADGVVEAIECPSHRFVVGVQWHPESMSAYGSADGEGAGRLFARFVDEARAFAEENGG